MDFSSPAHKEFYDKVSGWLKELFGEFVTARPDAPAFSINVGSAVVQMGAFEWSQGNVMLSTFAFVVSGAETTLDLTKYLLKENLTLSLGAYCLNDAGDIIFKHNLPAETCDKAQVNRSVRAVIWTADNYDDEITKRFGGQRATDRRS